MQVATRDQLTAMLDTLEAQLSGMVASYRMDGEFWMAYAGEADLIEDRAGEHAGMVQTRIQALLAKHGCYLATIG